MGTELYDSTTNSYKYNNPISPIIEYVIKI